jgi:hypothetical protein
MSTVSTITTTIAVPARNPAIGFGLLVALLALLAVGKVVLSDTLDPDCFWHLRVANQIAHQGWPGPVVDHLSFASSPQPWTPYSWLAELGMKWLWDAGGFRAAIAAQSGMEAGFLVLVALASLEATKIATGAPRYFAAAVATAMAAVLSLAYLSFRPVTAVLVILAFASWLLLRDRRMDHKSRAVWIIPALTALATNFHFFAIFIPLWTFALFVGDAVERMRANRADLACPFAAREIIHISAHRSMAHGAILMLLCAGAFLMTPLLPGMIGAILNYSFNDVMVRSGMISEMQPFYHGTMGLISAGLTALLLICVIRSHLPGARKHLGLGELFWLAGSALILLRVGRMAPVFAVIGAPWLAATLPALSDRVLSKLVVIGMIAAVLIAGTVRIISAFPDRSEPLSAWLNRNGPDCPAYPCAAADFVESHIASTAATPARLICEFSWGGYLEYRLGDRFQTLMDGRTQVFPTEFWHDAYFGSPEDQRRLLMLSQADVAIVPRQRSAFAKTLLKMNWKVVYEDEFAQVLASKEN